jgi:hypothetical protein
MKKCLTVFMVVALLILGVGCSSAPKTEEVTVTKSEFDKVDFNTSYEDVMKIVGGAGQIVSESGQPGDPDYLVTYQYKGDKPNSSAKFTFRNNKLTNKSQSNLE